MRFADELNVSVCLVLCIRTTDENALECRTQDIHYQQLNVVNVPIFTKDPLHRFCLFL